ncbi:MAG: permease, partial [bacterium]|nr:permease [bacterium]
MDRLRQDLGYAIRSLLRRPLFAAVVLGTLALGIGMNTAIFSVLYGVLYRPLGYAQPEELVRIGRTRPELPDVLLPISPGNFWELAPKITTLTRFEAEVGSSVVLTERGDPTRLQGARTTPGFFDLLGVPPAMGRTFNEADGTPGAEPVVLLSHQFWQTQLGADPSAVGTSLRLNDEPRTVIGVMGPDFEFGNGELWVPFVWTDSMKTFRRSNYLRLYGRLAPGQSTDQSTAELHELWTRQGAQYGDNFDDSGMSMIPLRDAFVQRSRTALLVLGGAVLFVLLIACANV